MRNQIQPAALFAALTLFATPFAFAAPAASSVAASPIDQKVAPVAASSLKVVVLPVVNRSGEKDDRQRADQIKKGDDELRKVFSERGFSVIDAETTRAALLEKKIDLTDEEFHNRATLYQIGKALGADRIVFVVITDVEQKRQNTPFGDNTELVARVKTKTWLLDVPGETAILSAKVQESQSKNDLFATFDSGARRIRNTVAGCIRDSLREFLKDYPVTKK